MLRRYLDKSQTGINAAAASVTYANAGLIPVKNAKRIAAIFTRTNHSAGSGLFEVYGSIDNGATFFALPFIEPIANTNAQNIARVVSKSLASNTSALVFIEEMFSNLTHISAQYTKTTDGNGSVAFLIEDELMS